MANIKNWTVTSESVKGKATGLIKYVQYLNKPDHPNHENTDIWNIFPEEKQTKFIKKCADEALTLDMKNHEKGKGGRPVESYAVSFDFILPPNTIRPTKDQWIAIAKDIYKVVRDGVDGELTQDHVYMNIHDQSNPHLNLVVSKVIDGERERKIDQKLILSKMKTQFNKSVLLHCNFDYMDYEPENIGLGKRKKRWQYAIEEENKIIQKCFNQFENLIKYSNQQNNKRVLSTQNRIVKSLSEMKEDNQEKVLDLVDETTDPQLKALILEIREKVGEPVSEKDQNTVDSRHGSRSGSGRPK